MPKKLIASRCIPMMKCPYTAPGEPERNRAQNDERLDPRTERNGKQDEDQDHGQEAAAGESRLTLLRFFGHSRSPWKS